MKKTTKTKWPTQTLNKNEAVSVFNLLNKYGPDTPVVKKQKNKEAAASLASGEDYFVSKLERKK